MVQVPLAEHHEVIQAFLAQSLNEPLDEGYGVRRAKGRLLNSQPGCLQLPVESCGELCIPIVHDDVGTQRVLASMFYERLGLLTDPGLVGMSRLSVLFLPALALARLLTQRWKIPTVRTNAPPVNSRRAFFC